MIADPPSLQGLPIVYNSGGNGNCFALRHSVDLPHEITALLTVTFPSTLMLIGGCGRVGGVLNAASLDHEL